jgi:hypothetical protein
LYCLSFVLFLLTLVLSVLRPFSFDHCIVCPSSFFFQYNGQKKKDEGLTIQESKEKGRRTDNTMVKRKRTKDRPYNGQKKKDPSSFFFWPLYCQSFVLFLLTMVLSVLRPFAFDPCIVSPSSFFFWPLYCQSFVYNGQMQKDERQTI